MYLVAQCVVVSIPKEKPHILLAGDKILAIAL